VNDFKRESGDKQRREKEPKKNARGGKVRASCVSYSSRPVLKQKTKLAFSPIILIVNGKTYSRTRGTKKSTPKEGKSSYKGSREPTWFSPNEKKGTMKAKGGCSESRHREGEDLSSRNIWWFGDG